MYFYLLLVILGLSIFHIVTRYGRMGRIVSSVPTEKPLLPVIGNALKFNLIDAREAWDLFRDSFKKYSPIVNWWLVSQPLVYVCDPEDIKIILTDKDNINKFHIYNFFKYWAETGLVHSGGKIWVERRKLINPAFHKDVLKQYLGVTNTHAKELFEVMRKSGENSEQNLTTLMQKLLFTIMTETSLGVHHKFFDKDSETYEHWTEIVFGLVIWRSLRPLVTNWMFNLMPSGRQVKALTVTVNDFANNLIKERRKYHEKTGFKFIDTEDDYEFEGSSKKFALLDLLLSLERKGLIDEKGILEEIHTFTAAAYDTTKSALVFGLLHLAENPECQELARKEAIQVMKECGENLTMNDMKKLEYIERCLKESMRIQNPVPLIGRKITKDLQLTNHVIPDGAEVIISPYHLHRDPKHWPNPLKFDPDRFLPERIQNQHTYAYIPFSAGPRNCIGQKLALLSLKALIALILYNYKLEPITRTEDLHFELSITLKPLESVYMRFIKIKN